MKDLNEIKSRFSPEQLALVEATKREVILGNELRRFRKEVAKLTQREVAERLNVSQAEVSKLENRRDMLINTLVAYCQAVHADLHITAHTGAPTVQLMMPEDVSAEDELRVEMAAGV